MKSYPIVQVGLGMIILLFVDFILGTTRLPIEGLYVSHTWMTLTCMYKFITLSTKTMMQTGWLGCLSPTWKVNVMSPKDNNVAMANGSDLKVWEGDWMRHTMAIRCYTLSSL